MQGEGEQTTRWTGDDLFGRPVPPGILFYQLIIDDKVYMDRVIKF